MTRVRKGIVLLAGFLLLVLAGCSSFSDIARDNYEVQPGSSYSVLVGKVQTSVEGQGSVFLFFGSISSTTQSSLRMGYTNASGNSYILDVPMKNIVFHAQDPEAEPSAQFSLNENTFPSSEHSQTFQDLIDYGLKQVVLTITPDQYKQLVTS